MWHDIVQLDVSTVEKLVRPVLIYGFLVVALRLAGKRELAQLNSLDFVVLLAVANAVPNGIIGDDDSVTGGVLGASALFVLNGALPARFAQCRHRSVAPADGPEASSAAIRARNASSSASIFRASASTSSTSPAGMTTAPAASA